MSGPLLLEQLADATGGQHFMVRSENELPDIAARIGVALHDQYMIGYQPPGGAEPGKWRRIRVRLQAPKGVPTLRLRANGILRAGRVTSARVSAPWQSPPRKNTPSGGFGVLTGSSGLSYLLLGPPQRQRAYGGSRVPSTIMAQGQSNALSDHSRPD
jgi:hypothetical protein